MFKDFQKGDYCIWVLVAKTGSLERPLTEKKEESYRGIYHALIACDPNGKARVCGLPETEDFLLSILAQGGEDNGIAESGQGKDRMVTVDFTLGEIVAILKASNVIAERSRGLVPMIEIFFD